jgi:hypothetical protein
MRPYETILHQGIETWLVSELVRANVLDNFKTWEREAASVDKSCHCTRVSQVYAPKFSIELGLIDRVRNGKHDITAKYETHYITLYT